MSQLFFWGREGNRSTDITQGYRAITRKAYKRIRISIPAPFAPDFEQVIKALKNITIYEFSTHEGKRIYGYTSFVIWKTGWNHFLLFW